jgi:hypothetical protein
MKFGQERRAAASRELTNKMLTDISADLRAGKGDDFTVTVAGSLLATANAEGAAYDAGEPGEYPPPGHSYPRR